MWLFFCPGLNGVSRFGLRSWHGVGIASAGQKLWRWLGRAPGKLLFDHLDGLLQLFVDTYHSQGGPLLDLGEVRQQFMIEALLHCFHLLDVIPRLFEHVPREQWAAFNSLDDMRLTRHPAFVWSAMASLVNILSLIVFCKVQAYLENFIPKMLDMIAFHVEHPRFFRVTVDRLEVHDDASQTSALVYTATRDSMIMGTGVGPVPPLQVMCPAPGWIHTPSSLVEVTEEEYSAFFEEDGVKVLQDLLAVMHHVRRKFVGIRSVGQCGVAAQVLRETIGMCLQLEQRLGSLCEVINGSFLVKEGSVEGYPASYRDWWPHSFVMFADGRIADITADQFGVFPKLWFPANVRHYSADAALAEDAGRLRVKQGQSMGVWRLGDTGAV